MSTRSLAALAAAAALSLAVVAPASAQRLPNNAVTCAAGWVLRTAENPKDFTPPWEWVCATHADRSSRPVPVPGDVVTCTVRFVSYAFNRPEEPHTPPMFDCV
jgi:hypothetical protein